MKQLSVSTAAAIIGVSSATMRNWAKAGHVHPIQTKPLEFSDVDVLNLKQKLSAGTLQKLTTRANKQASLASVLPAEYANSLELSKEIQWVVNQTKNSALDLSSTLFFAALHLLELRGEMLRDTTAEVSDLQGFHTWRRASVKAEMEHWFAQLDTHLCKTEYADIFLSLSHIDEDDFLGLLYQCLLNEGDKSNRGSYFTATKIVEDALRGKISRDKIFLDPCCGTGKYLTVAAKKLQLRPENIYGFDIDELSVKIARINLLLAFPDDDFVPKVQCLNSLTELATGDILCATNHFSAAFDFVATNPPWGAYKNDCLNDSLSYGVKSGESFSLFLAKSLTLLKPGGLLSFVLPESILRIKTHADIREIILQQARITTIAKLGRKFSGVFTAAIRLDMVKSPANSGWQIAIEDDVLTHVEQDRFRANENYVFDVEVNAEQEALLNKIYATAHDTLLNQAEWALGVVTGDNAQYVLPSKELGAEAIFKGGDVHPFRLGEPRCFIKFTPDDFQQVAPEHFFRAEEKLVYKFISKSLIFAYDDQQNLTLNSANILIPKFPNISIKVALAYLNSSVFQYVFQHKFATHKVLRGDLEKLPFPKISGEIHEKITQLVELILSGSNSQHELDELIFTTFNLSNEEIVSIKNSVGNK